MKQEEQELIAQILSGDQDSYATLIDRYKTGLYHHCFKIVHDETIAEDIAQEAFIDAFIHLDRYDPQYRFSTWLYKIATNKGLEHLRKRHDIRIDEDEANRIVSNLVSSEELTYYREVHEAVDDLPTKYKTVVSMHYWHGKSYAEIANSMGTSVGSVKGWMSRAKATLKEKMS